MSSSPRSGSKTAGSSSSSGALAAAAAAEAEARVKELRRFAAADPANKVCFDCGQRGPTYINMTAGTFVCTKCSGML